VAAENYLVNVAKGGKGGAMLVWPPDAKQISMLAAEGKGAARRFTKMRVTFDKKSVFVAIIDHQGKAFPYVDGLEADGKLKYTSGKTKKFAEVQTGFKFPYSASWWTIIGKEAREEKSGGVFSKSLVVFGKAGGWCETFGGYPVPSITKGGQWVLQLQAKYKPYRVMLTYPKTRNNGTPKNCFTVTDVIMEALGRDTYAKIVDIDGLRHRSTMIPAGEPGVMATCAGWWGLPNNLQAKNKDKYFRAAKALYNFCSYCIKRANFYRGKAKEAIKMCEDEAKKNPKCKPAMKSIVHSCREIEAFWKEENEKFRTRLIKSIENPKNIYLGNWFMLFTKEEAEKAEFGDVLFKKIHDYAIKMWDEHAEKPETRNKNTAKSLVRRTWWTIPGGMGDGILEGMRMRVKGIRQAAALAGVNSPEERAFALKIREFVHQMLKHYHYKEGAVAEALYRYDISKNASTKQR